jgi:hypothetical protein
MSRKILDFIARHARQAYKRGIRPLFGRRAVHTHPLPVDELYQIYVKLLHYSGISARQGYVEDRNDYC